MEVRKTYGASQSISSFGMGAKIASVKRSSLVLRAESTKKGSKNCVSTDGEPLRTKTKKKNREE